MDHSPPADGLDEVMPIPTQTRARGHPWPEACRMFVYEGVSMASKIAEVVGKSAARVRMVRSEDKWRAFAALEGSRRVAERNGLALPFLLAGASVEAQMVIERDSRAVRASRLRAELDVVTGQMLLCSDKGSVRYGRLLGAAAALRSEIEKILGMDIVRRVGTAAAIARATHNARRGPNRGAGAGLLAFRAARNSERDADISALPPV